MDSLGLTSKSQVFNLDTYLQPDSLKVDELRTKIEQLFATYNNMDQSSETVKSSIE